MPGMHGPVAAVTALQKADLIVALGARFDDRVTGQLSTFAPNAKVVHADIDPAEIGKNRKADVPIVGDAQETIAELVTALRAEPEAGRTADLSPRAEARAGGRRSWRPACGPSARPAAPRTCPPGGRSWTSGVGSTRSATSGPRT